MSALGRAREAGRSVASRVVGGMVGGAATLDRGQRDVVGVLTYHRIVDAGSPVPPGIASATPDEFARQMTMLAGAYHPISLGELLRRAGGGPALPRRSVLVTFDDGYRDFSTVAWPILRQLGVPAALFVPSGMPDTGIRFWWTRLFAVINETAAQPTWASPLGPLPLSSPRDRFAAYRLLRAEAKALAHGDAMALVAAVEAALGPTVLAGTRPEAGDVLDWSDLRSLAAEGVDIAAHSRTHPLLTKVPVRALDDEIGGSVAELADRLDLPPMAAFAYPSGASSTVVREAAARSGIQVAFTMERGPSDLRRCDWLAIRRINVGMRTDRAWLRGQLGSRLGAMVTRVVKRRGQRRKAGAMNEPAPAERG